MTLIAMEGFDYYTEDDLFKKKGWEDFVIGGMNIDSAYSRFPGGKGVYISLSEYAWMRYNLGINKSTVYMGMAIKQNQAGTPTYNSNDLPLIGFLDENGLSQVKIHVGTTYKLSAYDGTDTLLGSTADNAFPNNLSWFYFECKITISDTVGEVILRVNGTEVLNLTNQDTKNVSDYIRKIRFSAMYNDINTLFDDMYVDDAEFHGDVHVTTFYPDSDSATHTDFIRSTGSNDYECVDESPPTEDTDYIYSDTLNEKSTFGITTGAVGIVKGIKINNCARVDQAGVRKIKPLIRSNGSDYQGAETEEISADYNYFESEIFETDPDDSNPWTQTKLEAAEFGLEITT